MSVEQFIAILGAFTAVLGAIALCIREIRSSHVAINSQMAQLVDATRGQSSTPASSSPPTTWSDQTHPGRN